MPIPRRRRAARPAAPLLLALSALPLLGACNGRQVDESEPAVTSVAVYVADDDPTTTAGDTLRIRFDRSVVASGATSADFALAVLGDRLGDNPTVESGTSSDLVVITLGPNASLRARGDFRTGTIGPNAPSGIDVSAPAPGASNSIVGTASGRPARPTGGIDVTPGFADDVPAGFATPGATDAVLVDVDLDGDRDVVLAVSGAPGRLLLDIGGDLIDGGDVLGAGPSSALVAGDLDGDGDVDLVEGNDGGAADRVWLADGTGGFSLTPEALGGAATRDLLLADFDGDGALDLVTASVGPNVLRRGDGAGAFPGIGVLLGGFATEALVAADLDGDGDLDLVEGNRGSQGNRAYFNAGGVLLDAGVSLGADDTRALVAADLDRDGDVDVISANAGGPHRVHVNAGGGDLSETRSFGGDATEIALGDIDADGDLDVVTSGSSTRVYLSGGTLGFASQGQTLGDGTAVALLLADADRDGDLDAQVVDADAGVRTFRGSLSAAFGDVTLTDSGVRLGNEPSTAIALLDVDGDGVLDLAEGLADGLGNRLWFGDREGDFEDSGLSLGNGNTRALAAADLDRDGDLDLVAANDSSPNRVYLDVGTTLVATPTLLGAERSTDVAAGDLNGDGLVDLVFANREMTPDRVYLNSAATPAAFGPAGLAVGADSGFAVALGDFDQDGDLDLASGNDGDDRVYWNDGTAFFDEVTDLVFSGGPGTRDLAVADLDGDGDLDLASAETVGANRIWLNAGAAAAQGPFGDVTPAFVGTGRNGSVDLADLDGDGDVDILFAKLGVPSRIWSNAGDGTFPTAVDVASIAASAAGRVADVDMDGALDAVFANFDQPNTVFVSR